MKKLKAMALVAIFVGSMLYAPSAEAKLIQGNYIGSDGCLHVYTYHSILGGLITWGYA